MDWTPRNKTTTNNVNHEQMSKSNATHVHLKQTNLASEGTYKCEVSADSPSFTTITAERQMKIYGEFGDSFALLTLHNLLALPLTLNLTQILLQIFCQKSQPVLPKQKLSIIDNHLAAYSSQQTLVTNFNGNTTDSPQLHPQQQQQQSTHKATGSGNSGPHAYNLNDLVNLTCVSGASRPAAKLTWLLNETAIPSSSKWLSLQSVTYGAHLIETRLTIAFRLYPNQLSSLGTSNSIIKSPGSSILKLKCQSKLSVEFSSESSILVSGGKTTIKKRQKQASQLPLPSSLKSTTSPIGYTGSSISSRGHLSNNDIPPNYRWPQSPSTHQLMMSRFRNNRHEVLDSSSSSDSSFIQDSQVGVQDISSGWPPTQHVRLAGGGNSRSGHIVVWTRRQLQDQAEHISSMLKQSMPNEIETPTIEAHAKLPAEDSEEIDEGDLVAEDQAHNDGARDNLDQESVINSTLFSNNSNITAKEQETTVSERDYELNDAIEFTCKPKLAGSRSDNIIRSSMRLEWLINNREVSSNKINNFNGSIFSCLETLADSKMPRPSKRPETTLTTSGRLTTLSYEDAMESYAMAAGVDEDQVQNNSQLQKNSTLLLELSPSLFQLKELNLKCRTVIEQALIEYESQVYISMLPNGLSSPTQQSSQFIVANQAQTQNQDERRNYKSPWKQRPGNSRSNGANQNYGQNSNRLKNKSNLARQSSSSSAQSNLDTISLMSHDNRPVLMLILSSLLTILILY